MSTTFSCVLFYECLFVYCNYVGAIIIEVSQYASMLLISNLHIHVYVLLCLDPPGLLIS